MSDVVFLPDYSDNNPYQEKLATGLENYGVDVTFGPDGAFPILRSIRNRGDPQILHLHWLQRYTLHNYRLVMIVKIGAFFFELLLFRFLLGGTVIWTVHNLLEHERRWPRTERTVKRVFVRFFCDQLIVHCDVAADAARNEFGPLADDSIEVIPHGHYIDTYGSAVSTEDARTEIGLDPDRRVLLFFGAIRRYKGVPDLIEAFKRAVPDETDLVIAGNPRTDEIKRDIQVLCDGESRIRTDLRFIDSDTTQLYFSAADAIVAPYRDVLTSGTVVLGMSFQRAAIVPRIGCLPEMLPERGAVFYDPAESSGLEEALLAATNADLKAMGQRNYRRAQNLSWDRIAAATERIYKKGQEA